MRSAANPILIFQEISLFFLRVPFCKEPGNPFFPSGNLTARTQRVGNLIFRNEGGRCGHLRSFRGKRPYGKIQFFHAGQQLFGAVITIPEQIPVFCIILDEGPEIVRKTVTELRI